MKGNLILVSFVAAAALLALKPAAATPIYNNLNSANNGTDQLSSDGGPGPLGDSFSTGSSANSLTGVTLKLADSTPNDGYNVTVELWSDDPTAPGGAGPNIMLTTIGSIDDSALTTSLADYVFTLGTPYALTANTRYWIMAYAGSGNAVWAWSYDQGALGVSGEYFHNSGGLFPNTDGPYQMLVSGTANTTSVPEPAPFVLVALGSLAGLWWSRKRA